MRMLSCGRFAPSAIFEGVALFAERGEVSSRHFGSVAIMRRDKNRSRTLALPEAHVFRDARVSAPTLFFSKELPESGADVGPFQKRMIARSLGVGFAWSSAKIAIR